MTMCQTQDRANVIHRMAMGRLLVAFTLLAWPLAGHATHSAGAELTYTCVGNNQYRLDITFYRDCNGIAAPATIPITYRSQSCGYTLSAMAGQTGTGTEITLPCITAATTCNGGVLTGIQKYRYSVIVTLPAACPDWIFSYQVCCRNCAITTIQNPCAAGSNLYVEAGLDMLAAPCNNSPEFANDPIAVVCVGQPFHYNPGIAEADGDSLAFELIPPKTGPGTQVSYQSGFSAASPLLTAGPLTLDEATGELSFNPLQVQAGIITLRVNEYRQQQRIGSVMRDIQVYTVSCINSLPWAGGLNGTSSYSADAYPGEPLSLVIHTGDSDATGPLTVTVGQAIPGAQWTVGTGPQPDVQVAWTPGKADVSERPHVFTITVQDDACPINGKQVFTYSIYVRENAVAVKTVDASCAGASDGAAYLVNAPAGATVIWSTGDTALSVTGLPAGIYHAAIHHHGMAQSITASIGEPSRILPSVRITAPVACKGEMTGALTAAASGGLPPYTYLWSNGAAGASVSGLAAGTYLVTVTDSTGCMALGAGTITEPSIPLSVDGNTTAPACLAQVAGKITALATGGTPPYAYTWSTGQSTPHIDIATAGIYVLTVTDQNGCSDMHSFQVDDASAFAIHAGGPTTFCVGEVVTLTADTFPDAEYQWYLNGQTLGGAVYPAFVTPVSGDYSARMTNGCGTYLSDTLRISALSPAPLVLGPNVIICPGERTRLSAAGAWTYAWHPADGLDDPASSYPLASPAVTTTYTVEATDANGCKTSGDITVTVLCDSLTIPSGYSPNDDGINDRFVIRGIENYPGNKVWIYNRWGQLVYKCVDYRNSWDGICNVEGTGHGQKIPKGTYFYLVDPNDGSAPRRGYLVIRK